MLKKSPQQLTPAALENALKEFVQAHEAIFDQWFRHVEADQRERISHSSEATTQALTVEQDSKDALN